MSARPSPAERLIRAYARLVVRRPLVPLLVALVLTGALVPGLLRVRFASDLAALFPDGPAAGAARALTEFLHAFAGREPVVVLVTGADAARVRATAERLASRAARHREVAAAVDRIESSAAAPSEPAAVVGDVLRLADARTRQRLLERLRPEQVDRAVARARTLLLAPGGSALGPELRLDPLGLRSLLADAVSRLGAGLGLDDEHRLFARTPGRGRPYAALVLVRPRAGTLDLDASERLLEALARDARAVGADTTEPPGAGARLHVGLTGPAAMGPAVRSMIQRDLQLSTLLATVLVVAVFLVTFRRGRAALAVVPPLAVGGAWTTAIAGLALPGLDAVTVAFGAVVLGLGADAGIHLYAHVLHARVERPDDPEAAIEDAVARTVPTVVSATAATAVAFGALALAELRPVRHLGLLGAIGDVATCTAILLLVPPVAVLLERRARVHDPGEPALARALARLAVARSLAVPRVVAGLVLAALLALAVLGLPPLAASMVAVRPASLAPLRVQGELFERFGGRPGQWLALLGPAPRAEVLAAGDRASERLASLVTAHRLSGFETLTTLLPTEATQRARLEGRPRVELEAAARALEESLGRRGFALAPFAGAIEALRAPSGRTTAVAATSAGTALLLDRHLARAPGGWLLALYVHPRPGAETGHLRAVLGAALRDVRAGRHGVRLTGYPLLEADVRAALLRSFPRVAAAALALVVLVLLATLRGMRPAAGAPILPVGRAAAVAVAGVAVEIALVLLALRLAGVELDAYAVLALPVVVGVTIDETLFVLQAASEAPGASVAERVAAAVRGSGRATMGTTATAIAAFAPLLVCGFDGLRSIGWVGAAGAALGLLSALVVVPALVRLAAR